MTFIPPSRHAALLSASDARAFLAAPGFPLPDAKAMRRVGSVSAQEFLQTGLLLRAAIEETVGIAPDHAILDIGCGWGRLALPLAARLGPDARYVGMDAAAEAIAWCRRHIAEADARFRFHHADIRNSYANPRGRIPAARAVLLPWEERFDRVVAFSLFTHLLPEALARYLAEAARLCRPGGALVATFFLLDAQARAAIADGTADLSFPVAHGIARIAATAVPEDAVAYDADDVLALLDAAGFDAEWRPGAWCPRKAAPFEYQDLVVARRRGRAGAAGGTRGAVSVLSAGAFRGWARQSAGDLPPLRLEIGGQTVSRAAPDDAGAFALPVPPHLLGKEVRDLRILAGHEELPLLTIRRRLLADPAEELARAWRIEAARLGLWRVETLEWPSDGSVEGVVWAIPPRAMMPARPPFLSLTGARVPLLPVEDCDDAAGAAFGLAPGAFRPRYRFRLPAGLPIRGAVLRLLGSEGEAWEPSGGRPVPGVAPAGSLAAALDRLAAGAALRAATGLSLAGLTPGVEVPASPLQVLEAAPAGRARLILALEGLDLPALEAEGALVDALARVAAPGGILVAGLAGATSLLDGQGGSARLLQWLRCGREIVPHAPPGRRMLRSRQHLHAAWGGMFDILRVTEGAFPDFRAAVVMRRHPRS